MLQAIGAAALLLALTRGCLAHSVVSSATVFLPHATEGLWASVITEAASATEYLIACSSSWENPEDCEAPFTGVTLTARPSGVIDIELGSILYHCSRNEVDADAVCQTRTPADTSEETLIIEGTEISEWVATMGVVKPTQVIELRDEVQRSPQDDGGGSSGGGGGGGGGGGW
jgi:hypothetical protein